MAKTQDLLKKISYIEADIEIHKQILFSLPSDQRQEMEKTVQLIAAKKKEIEELLQEIRESDPEEFNRILALEKTIDQFRELTKSRQFTAITGRNINEPCVLSLQNGDTIECLVKACDSEGNWTVITLEGQLREYPGSDVAEKPVTVPVH
ncbi:MAG: hypothetical protein OEL83_18515 [Desulforhopalus sp.]|nr:hypothetical protein [Desulforhopalus sp.]